MKDLAMKKETDFDPKDSDVERIDKLFKSGKWVTGLEKSTSRHKGKINGN